MIDIQEHQHQKQLQLLKEEEEMSEDELEKQAQNDELYKIKKAIQNIDVDRYNTLKIK